MLSEQMSQETEAIAYDTAIMAMEALTSSTVNSRKELIAYLQKNTFKKMVIYPTSFDSYSEPSKSLELFQVEGDNLKLIRT